MTRGDNRTKIIERWRRTYAELLSHHKDAAAIGDKEQAASIVTRMRNLEKAIRAYSEDRMGEHAKPAKPAKGIRIKAGGFDVTEQMPRTAARLDELRKIKP